MGKEIEQIHYDFTNDYKKLPIKKRVNLIKIAKNLLRQQMEDRALLADLAGFSSTGEDKKN